MTALRSSVVLVIFNFVWTVTTGDVTVSCRFKESCILPCTYNPGADPVIHWLLGTEQTKVHTYYHQQDQLALQEQSFRGRTSLFKDQISRGNASLLLTGLKLQDKGRFKCYTSTIKGHQESFIDLKVEAPVSEVDIKRSGDTIICNSENIYPEPQLIWSTDPPSNISLMNPTTTVQKTEEQLYSISSSLPDSDDSMNFICTISSGTSRKKATLFKSSSVSGSRSETVIPCTDTGTSYTFLIWKSNNSEIILEHRRPENYRPSLDWAQYVKDLSHTGSLTLTDLPPEKGGLFTCELSNSGDQYVKTTLVHIPEEIPLNATAIAIGVLCLLVLLAVLGGICYWRSRVKKNRRIRVPSS